MKTHLRKRQFQMASLEHEELIMLVSMWVQNIDHQVVIHRLYFKYFPHFVTSVPEKFIASAIIYAIQKRFTAVVKQISYKNLIQLSNILKADYIKFTLVSIFKKDNYFYFLCVYLTKLIAVFLQQLFVDLQVDKQMQGEFYIVIVHVLLGLEVSTKSYEINHRKIINQKYLKLSTNSLSICKADSIQSIASKPSTMRLYCGREKRKLLVQRKGAASIQKYEEPTGIDLFRNSIKEHLAVKVLPKLSRKKIKAYQIDEQSQQNAQSHSNIENKEVNWLFEKLQQQRQHEKPSAQFLQSNQISSSFDFMFSKNNKKINFIHRNVKISHRPQIFVQNKHKIYRSLGNQRTESEYTKQNSIESLVKQKNWGQIINGIKHSISITKRVHLYQNNTKQTQGQMKRGCYRSTTELRINTVGQHTQADPKQLSLIKKRNPFISTWIQGSIPLHCSNKTNCLKSNELRLARHNFNISCENRHQKVKQPIYNFQTQKSML